MRYLKNWTEGNKVIPALAILLFTGGILYLFFGHRIVEAASRGESLTILNKIMEARPDRPLDMTLKMVDIFYIQLNILFACLVLSSSFGLRLIKKRNNLFELAQKELSNFKAKLFENSRAKLLSISLLLFFYCLYLIIGFSLIPIHQGFDFFEADIREWTSLEWSINHHASHPLIVLFFAPFSFIKAFSPPFSTESLAVSLNSLFGAFAVFLASLFFWKVTKSYVETLLLSVLFGLSASQLVFSSLPDTYALASCSIIATYILLLVCLRNQKVYLAYWILAGIFSFGVTITNFAQTLICFVVTVFVVKKRNQLTTILEYIGTVITLCFLLSLLQRQLFPETKYFFVPYMLTSKLVYVKMNILSHPLIVLRELIKNFFLVNFVAPFPSIGDVGGKLGRLPLGFFVQPLKYSVIGFIGTILWIVLFITGVYKNTKDIEIDKNKLIFFLTVSLGILINMALHSFLGSEYMFLYTCNFTFLVLLLAVNKSLLKHTYFKIGLISLVFLMAVNNLMVITQMTETQCFCLPDVAMQFIQ